MNMITMKYEPPILSPDHAFFCICAAVKRYRGSPVRDTSGYVIVDADGVTHTDEVLQAVSMARGPLKCLPLAASARS
jgi:hypothetical protein